MAYESVGLPKPAHGEALIRQTAIGVNFLDIYHRRGDAKPPGGLPFVNGFEGAGVIEALGEGCGASLRVGQRVGYTLAMGAYATHRCVPAARLVALPDMLSDEAAAVLLKGTTAEYLVRRVHAISAADVVLVHAAAGGVGLLISQWAKHLGATVIGVVSSEAKAVAARKIGKCDEVFVASGAVPDFAGPIRAALGQTPISVVYDGVAGLTLHQSLGLLRPRGVAVVLGNAGGSAELIDVHSLKARSLTVVSPSLSHYTGSQEDLIASSSAVFAAVQAGWLEIASPNKYELRDAAHAHRALEGRLTTGSVVLCPT